MALPVKTRLNNHNVAIDNHVSSEHYRLALVFPYLKRITLARYIASVDSKKEDTKGWIVSSNFIGVTISKETLFYFDLEGSNRGLIDFSNALKRGRQSPFGSASNVFQLSIATRFGTYQVDVDYHTAYELFHIPPMHFLKLICDYLPEQFYEELQAYTPFPICLK